MTRPEQIFQPVNSFTTKKSQILQGVRRMLEIHFIILTNSSLTTSGNRKGETTTIITKT